MLSVMVLGAGAAFSDQADIENTEAVGVCSALNIIGGYEDGSFHPERNIKRSEITKMICVALNGGKEPNVSTNAVPTFSDVRGTSAEWAEGYIEACVAQGIVSGVGGGRFAPDGNVTGAQLAKMLLVSLGYNADNETFTGDTWETNVNVRASQKHLYDGLENLDTSAAVTRDQAAQMVWNALQAYEVEYKTNLVTDANGNLTTQITVQDKVVADTNDKITLLFSKYEATIFEGVLVATGDYDLTREIGNNNVDPNVNDAADSNGFVIDVERIDGVLRNTHNTFFEYKDHDLTDLMGQTVKTLYNNKTGDIYSVYAVDGKNTVLETAVSLTDYASLTNKVKVDGTTYSLESDIWTVVGNGNDNIVGDDFADCVAATSIGNRADKVVFVDNDGNGKFDVALVTPVDVAEITYKNDTNIHFTPVVGDTGTNGGDFVRDVALNGNSQQIEDMIISGELAIGDYAILTPDYYSDSDTLTKVDVASGTVSGVRNPFVAGQAPYRDYQIDDVWYRVANNNVPNSNIKSGSTVDYVAVEGVLFYVQLTSKISLDDLAVIYDMGVDVDAFTDNVLKAKVAFGDKTTSEVTVAGIYDTWNADKDTGNRVDVSDGNWNAESAYIGRLMSYKVNNDGEYEFYLLSDTNSNRGGFDDVMGMPRADLASSVNIGATRPNSEWTINGTQVADEAVIVVRSALPGNTGDVKILSGSEFKNITGDAVNNVQKFVTNDGAYALVGKDADGFTRVLFATVQATAEGYNAADEEFTLGTITGSNYGYLVKASWSGREDKTDYNYFEIWDGTQTVTVKEEGNAANYVAGSLITFNNDGDDNIVEDVQQLGGAGAITSKLSNGKIEIDGITYDVDNDTVIMNVDDAAKEGVDSQVTTVADKIDTNPDRYALNAYYHVTNGTLDVLVVDVDDNRLDTTVLNGTNLTNNTLANAFRTSNIVEIDGNANNADALTIPDGKTLVVRGTLTMGANITVDGVLLAYDLAPSGNTLRGSGLVNVDGNLRMASGINGKLIVNAKTATLAGNFTIEGGAKVTIKGAMSTENGPHTLTINVADVQIRNVNIGTGTISVNGTNNNVVIGDIFGNVTVATGATGNVKLGNMTGNIDNKSDSLTVSVNTLKGNSEGNVSVGSAGGTTDAGASMDSSTTIAGNLQADAEGTTVNADVVVNGDAKGEFILTENTGSLTVDGVKYSSDADSGNSVEFNDDGSVEKLGTNVTANLGKNGSLAYGTATYTGSEDTSAIQFTGEDAATVTSTVSMGGQLGNMTVSAPNSGTGNVILNGTDVTGAVDLSNASKVQLSGNVDVAPGGKLTLKKDYSAAGTNVVLNVADGATLDDGTTDPIPANVTMKISAGATVMQSNTAYFGGKDAILQLSSGTLTISQNSKGASEFTLNGSLKVLKTASLLKDMSVVIADGSTIDFSDQNYNGNTDCTFTFGENVKVTQNDSNIFYYSGGSENVPADAMAGQTFTWSTADSGKWVSSTAAPSAGA